MALGLFWPIIGNFSQNFEDMKFIFVLPTYPLCNVRSIFKSCSVIWRPNKLTMSKKIEGIWKRAVKWILNEEGLSYASKSVYIYNCKQLKILPMSYRFEMTDLVMLHKIIHSLVPVELPAYLSFYRSSSRLRFDHLDNLCRVSAVIPNTTTSQSRTSMPLQIAFSTILTYWINFLLSYEPY